MQRNRGQLQLRRFGAKPDKNFVDPQAAMPSSWKTPCMASCKVFFVERDEVDDVLAKALVTADAATHARLEHAKAQLEAASKKHDAAHRELDDVLAEKRPTRPFAPSSSTPRPSSRLPPSSALRRCATRDWRRRQPSATSSPPSCAGCCSTGLYTGRK